jgi:hypothetical protein
MRLRIGGSLLMLLATTAALSIGVSAARASGSYASGTGPQGLVLSYFELEGTHGYTVEAGALKEGNFPTTVGVFAKRAGLSASYEVPGELEPGMHAVFGSLGHVAVGFHRKKRSIDRPEKGCTYITETGVFRGEFSFAGEGGYTSVEATSAPGKVLRLPNGLCGFGDDRRSPRRRGIFSSTSLVARSRIPHGFIEFEATAPDIAPVFGFQARTRESLGPMTISRSASAKAMDGDVRIGPGKRPRRIDVNPSPPFAGSARFRDPARSPPAWTGSLSVSLPGAPALALAGPDFAARLCMHISLLARCKIALPSRAG